MSTYPVGISDESDAPKYNMLFRVDKEVSKYRPTDSRFIGLEYDTILNTIQ